MQKGGDCLSDIILFMLFQVLKKKNLASVIKEARSSEHLV